MLDLENYTPSSAQLKQLELLFQLLDLCNQKDVRVFITGGYGYDALYGKLTRDHRDVDVQIFAKDEQTFTDILKSLDFQPTGTVIGVAKKKEYRNDKFSTDFTIEYAVIEEGLKLFPGIELANILPPAPLGKLNGVEIWTAAIPVFKKMIEFNNTFNTEAYRHREWLEEIWKEIDKKF